MLIAWELGEPVYDARPLTPPSRMTWAARAQRTGAIVVKARYGDRADEKTQWCAVHRPALGARGMPQTGLNSGAKRDLGQYRRSDRGHRLRGISCGVSWKEP